MIMNGIQIYTSVATYMFASVCVPLLHLAMPLHLLSLYVHELVTVVLFLNVATLG